MPQQDSGGNGDERKASTLSILLVACWLGMGLVTASCGSLPKESADAQSQSPDSGGRGDGATPVDVAIARSELLRQQPEYIGTTTAFRTVSLRSQAEGRLLSLNLDVGDAVTRGQNVGQLDDVLLVTTLKQAEAELAARKSEVAKAINQVSNARAEVEQRRLEVVQAQADSQRQQKLLIEGAIAEQAAEQAQTKVQTSIQILRAATEQVRTEQQAVAAAQGRVLVQQAVVAQAKERRSYTHLTNAAVSGALLAAAAVLLFLGSLRQAFIISLAIPLCTLAAVILMKQFNLSLNIFSLGGLALGIGQAIDTSVVILENMAVRAGMNFGKDAQTQLTPERMIATAIASSQEVESSLIASTGANLISVLPFLLIGGFISLLFNELILTITFAVAASLLVALTIVPMLASRLFAIKSSSGINRFWLLRQFNSSFAAATQGYARNLTWVVRHRLIVIAIAIILLGGASWWMAPQIPQEILPRINTGQANLIAQFPPGTPLETNQKVMKAVDDILRKQSETEYIFSTVGGSLFGTNTNANPLRSSSTITLKAGTNVEAYIERVTKQFNKLNLAGIRLRLSPGQLRGLILNNSPVRNADVDIILQGNDADALEQAGRQVLAALEEQATLVRFRPDADARQPEIQIRPDWERVAALGLNTKEIGETIQTAIAGSIPTQLQRGNRLVDVRVQLNEASVQAPSQLQRLPLFVDNNRQVRLSDVATIVEAQAPGEVQRINQRQVFLIAGNLNEGASLSDALAQVNNVVNSLELPAGVSILPSSALESNQQLQNSLQLLGGLAAFLVFVVMAVQYNSLIDPLVIMLTIPLALAGGIFGLYITKTAIGATVIVGAVLLVGIVVNNAIIMIELANQIREQDKVDHNTAILQAAPQRLRPVLMTTITTVLGIFPLALGIGEGAEFLQPLGIVVFSGLSLATLLTLFIIPCFYTLLHDFLAWGWVKPVLQSFSGK